MSQAELPVLRVAYMPLIDCAPLLEDQLNALMALPVAERRPSMAKALEPVKSTMPTSGRVARSLVISAPGASMRRVRPSCCRRGAIRAMFAREFAGADMVCLVENLFEDGDWAILEWRDPNGLRGCGFFRVTDGLIRFQRGYWDRLTFLKAQGLDADEALRRGLAG